MTITKTTGELVTVEIRPHSVDTRMCPTTRDAEELRKVTHAVYATDAGGSPYILGLLYRGTLGECRRFVADRQSTEATTRRAQELL